MNSAAAKNYEDARKKEEQAHDALWRRTRNEHSQADVQHRRECEDHGQDGFENHDHRRTLTAAKAV